MEKVTPLMQQIPEACRSLGVGRSLLYEMIAAGRVIAVKLGNRTLIPAVELHRLADELIAEARAKRGAK